MKKRSSTFIAGVLAFGTYFMFLLLLLFYFNYSNNKKSLHFVKKNNETIRISLASPSVSRPKKRIKKVSKHKEKKKKAKKIKEKDY